MKEAAEFLKAFGNLGIAGLIVWLIYKLVDKWAPQFLATHKDQAKAMGDLASAVREGQSEQRDLIIAVRALAAKIDQQKEYIGELDRHVRGKVEAE